MKVKILTYGVLFFVAAVSVAMAAGQYKQSDIRLAPRLLNYQGYLTDTLGNPITNPALSLSFAIFDSPSSGSQKWSENQGSVAIDKGIFNVLLGSVTSIPDSVFLNSTDRYLQLTVAGQVLSPRTRIVSVPYAYTSTYSDTAQYARISAPDNDWTFRITDGADTTLQMNGQWGLARAGNVMYGTADSTHVNFGVACTTGTSSYHYKYCTVSGGRLNTASGSNASVSGGYANTASGPNASVGGGSYNTASNSFASVDGGYSNVASGYMSTVGGGFADSAKTVYSGALSGYSNLAGDALADTAAVVVGGWDNSALAKYSYIGGGRQNIASGAYSVIDGGFADTAGGDYATVGGGNNNTANSYSATVAGGDNNTAGSFATVAGGGSNSAGDGFATVGGGFADTVKGLYGSVLGGYSNLAGDVTADTAATVAGGYDNHATGRYAFVGGGRSNTASGTYTIVGGGIYNAASGYSATVSGGVSDTAAGGYATIGGGVRNAASGYYATVGGGYNNTADTSYATVGGGYFNTASGYYGVVGGGYYNTADTNYAAVGGGASNMANGYYGTVGGGYSNVASGYSATVGGGYDNSANVNYGTIGGGYSNWAAGGYGTVGGGNDNTASGYYGTVGGGISNAATGGSATVAGGYNNSADAERSFATNYSTLVSVSDTNSAAFTTSHTIAKNQVRAAAFSTGTLDFAMDHPHDPMNKILNQYAVGSDEVMFIYRGSVILDATGRAVVNLPDYFDDINRNPMIQLTGVGSADVVFVAEDVRGNTFIIGGKPGTKVYWTVTAERQDIHAEIARIQTPVVQEKKGDLRGHSIDDDAMIGIYDGLHTKNPELFKFKTEEGRSVHEQCKKMITESR